MKRIIVTGAGGSAAINFINSLRMAQEKFYIVGLDMDRYFLEVCPADKRFQIIYAYDPDYIEKLNKIIESENVEFVHPQPEQEVDILSKNKDKIKAKTLLPRPETIQICQNKMALIEKLARAGIPTPKSLLINSEEDVKEAFRTLGKKLWFRAIKGAGSRAALPIVEPSHAVMWIDYWKKMRDIGYGSFMASEFLPGKEFAFQSVWYDGELITSQARERLKYLMGHLMPSGQTSTPSLARTVNRNDVNETATKAVELVDKKATGIFCIDMKENAEGIPCVTEINAGRFFTTSNFFSAAGVNMPYIYVKLAYGEEIPPVKKYNPLPEELYWVRVIDGGYKLIKGGL
jgi:carbamoyl-phosphate synthase large subunit